MATVVRRTGLAAPLEETHWPIVNQALVSSSDVREIRFPAPATQIALALPIEAAAQATEAELVIVRAA